MSEQELCSAPVQQTPPPAPPAPRPVRRVGTTTMGLVLVVAGIAITAGMLNPDLDFSLLCKLSPLVLVALGVEVLIAACTARQAKLKYDVLSMFVCAFLIIAALCGTAAAPMLEYVGPARQKAVRQLEEKIALKEQELEELRSLRFEPEYYHDFKKMNELDERIDALHVEIDHLMETWESYSEHLE